MAVELLQKEKQTTPAKERIYGLDALRGGAMLLVIAYHLLYDLKFIYGINIPRVITPGQPEPEFVHICFLWVLFAVSGICSGFSRDPVKRGAFLYIIGWGITVITSLFVPSQLIVFGVLSCFGACMVITGLAEKLISKARWQILFIASFLLWLIFMDFHRSGEINLFFTSISVDIRGSEYLYPLGMPSADFFSTDYFPLIPYYFMFLAGRALYIPVSEKKLPGFFYRKWNGVLEFIGRHSLIIYAVHQPIILLLLSVISACG